MSENILLTITMLVSGREDTIEKCMKSLAHLREAVPSELIVVDTAGNQACMDIVRQYTDKIVRFEWCNDFSAARNAGVEKAQGQWLMYLDDDEWFESTKELENFFLSGDYRNFFCASYLQRNYSDAAAARWMDARVVRLVKRVEGTRFIRKIHEQFFPLNSPVCYLNDYVHHFGYAYSSKEEKDRHLWRNIRLLLEQRKETPEDTQVTAQLIQEYAVAQEYYSAIELCKELWTEKENWAVVSQAQYATFAIGVELRMYLSQKRYTDGYDAGKNMLTFLKERDNSILAKGILCNLMTEFCYQLGKYEEALEYIDRFYDCKKKWDRYPDPNSLDALSECAIYVNAREASRLALLRLHVHVLREDWEKAKAALLAVEWQGEDILIISDTPADVIALLKREVHDKAEEASPAKSESGHDVYISSINAIYSKENMRPALYAAVDKSKPEEKRNLLAYLYQVSPEDVKMCVYHIIYAGQQGEMEAVASALEKMQEKNYPFFLEDEAYWNSLQKLGININAYMTSLSINRWMEMAKRLWDVMELEVCEKVYPCLICGLEKTDLRYLYVSALLQEKKLLKKEMALENAEEFSNEMYSAPEIWNELYQMSQFWVSCAASLYKEDVFMGDLIKAIPPSYQFGWYIMQANAVKNNNLSLFRQKVADAAKAYPALKELCKKVIKEI